MVLCGAAAAQAPNPAARGPAVQVQKALAPGTRAASRGERARAERQCGPNA